MWYAFVIAFLGGFLPSIVWLIFWNEEKSNREPKKMVFLAFVGGIAAVFLSLLFEKIIFSVDPQCHFLRTYASRSPWMVQTYSRVEKYFSQ